MAHNLTIVGREAEVDDGYGHMWDVLVLMRDEGDAPHA